MSAREFDRLKTIQAIIDGNLRPSTAADRLHISRRQVDRLVARYRSEGAAQAWFHANAVNAIVNCLPTLKT